MIRVAHVITGLGVGGAEMMLVKLLSGIDRTKFSSVVLTLSDDDELAERVILDGTPVRRLRVRPTTLGGLAAMPRLVSALAEEGADIIQTWLYHADLMGGLAGRLLGLPVVWNVQTSTIEPGRMGARTRRVARICGALSRTVPTKIVSCSRAAIESHAPLGYVRTRFHVIPNGADLKVFRPDAEIRREVRSELGFDESQRVLGMIARLHPQKDHESLFLAVRELAASWPELQVLLCGRGLESENQEIVQRLRDLGIERHVRLLGVRSDIPQILQALDIHVLSSAFGEGFPNVLGEAMATGVPCVVTDVGDCRLIVGDTGLTVPPRDPAALANAIRRMMDLSDEAFDTLRVLARNRVEIEFSLDGSIRQYESLYESMCHH